MTQNERLEILKSVAVGIAKMMGKDTEVVLHDLYKGEVEFIVNSHITGREVGYKMNTAVYEAIMEKVDDDGHLIGYSSQSGAGKKLRSSHMLFKEEDGTPCVLICINQDTSKFEEAINYLASTVEFKHISDDTGNQDELDILDENFIQKMTQKAILDSVEKMKPTDISTKEGKIELLRRLKLQGIFNVKDAVPYVCRILSISQATLYNYLRDLRSEEEL